MLRIRRSVQATYNTQVNFMASQMLKVSGSTTGTGEQQGAAPAQLSPGSGASAPTSVSPSRAWELMAGWGQVEGAC